MESGAALVQPGEAPVNQASNVSEAPGPLSGSSASCFRGLRSLFWLQRPFLVCTLWLPGDFRRLVRETFKLTFCMDDPFTQSQDVLDSIIKTRIYAQTGLLFKPSPLKRLPLHLVQCHQRDRVLFWKTPHADYVGPVSVTKSKPITPCDGPCLATPKRFWEKWGGGREGDSASHSNSSKSRRMLHSVRLQRLISTVWKGSHQPMSRKQAKTSFVLFMHCHQGFSLSLLNTTVFCKLS